MAGDAGGGAEVTPIPFGAFTRGFPGDGGATVKALIRRWHPPMARCAGLTAGGKD